MSTVWAIVGTDYEDHGTQALFTTKELAEQHMAQLNDPSLIVEEMDVLDYLPKKIRLRSWQAMKVFTTNRLVNIHVSSHDWWDHEAPELGMPQVRRNAHMASVIVHDTDSADAERIGRAALEEIAP